MPVELKQLATIKIDDQEYTGILTKVVTIAKVTCDNDHCQGNKTVEWEDGNPDAVPPEAYKLINVEDFIGMKRVFCSAKCLDHWLLFYKPLKAPHRQKAIQFPENGQ